jgi:hypothetical protein
MQAASSLVADVPEAVPHGASRGVAAPHGLVDRFPEVAAE